MTTILVAACGSGHEVSSVPDRSRFLGATPGEGPVGATDTSADAERTEPTKKPPKAVDPNAAVPEPGLAAAEFLTNADRVELAGSCANGMSVAVSGTVTEAEVFEPRGQLVTACASGAFKFSIGKSVDGDYTFKLVQQSAAGKTSPAVTAKWTRDTTPPPAPTQRSPLSALYTSGDDSLTIAGDCETGATVTVAGMMKQTMECGALGYTTTFTSAVDGQYDFTLTQTDAAGNVSSPVTLTWVRDSSIPPTPALTAPTGTGVTTSGTTLSLTGTCTTGYKVTIGGDVTTGDVMTPSGSLVATCAAGSFTFVLQKAMDGVYNLLFRQTNPANSEQSAVVAFVWARDTVAPAAPSVSVPATSPFVSSESSLTIAGGCEAGTTVSLSGASASSQPCAAGAFSFLVMKNADGTYDFTVSQRDAAGNSSGTVPVRWVRDSSVPAPPTLTKPSPNPRYAGGASIEVSGTCLNGYSVSLSGDVTAGEVTTPSGSLSLTCAANAFKFIVAKSSDSTYRFFVAQRSNINGMTSGTAQATWIRDTAAPAAPVIQNPASSPYRSPGNLVISGTCEDQATVALSGDDTQSAACSANAFSFTVVKSSDATYNFAVKQTDRAGNVSSAAAVVWERTAGVPPPPTIEVPSASTYLSNASQLTISGTCLDGLPVTISGDVAAGDMIQPAGSLVTTCATGRFDFVVQKTSDGSYHFSIVQTRSGMPSASADRVWNRDASAPDTQVTSNPDALNHRIEATFVLSSPDATATFECAIASGDSADGATYSACTSPVTYSSLPTGRFTFAARARDQAGNIDPSPVTYNWMQQTLFTIALYHLDAADPTADSSQIGGGALSDSGTTAIDPGKFGQARGFPNAAATMTAPDAVDHDALTGAMSVETWVWVEAVTEPSTTELVEKTGAAGSKAWRMALEAASGKHKLVFSASLDGASQTDVRSGAFDLSTGAWHHVAATWNRGAIALYVDGTQVGSGLVGTPGVARLFASDAPITLGGGNGAFQLDDVRVSQGARWSAAFTPPAAAYTAD